MAFLLSLVVYIGITVSQHTKRQTNHFIDQSSWSFQPPHSHRISRQRVNFSLCDITWQRPPVRQRVFHTIAFAAGTDKVTTHQYQHVYQRFLGPMSGEQGAGVLFIEIGFAAGASARAFRGFMPNADLHEIEVGCAQPRRPQYNDWIYDAPMFAVMRAEGRLHCGSGADAQFMLPLLKQFGRAPHIVIDDGGHSAAEMIGSFMLLFPRLAPCGLFFMEDLAESYRVGNAGFHNQVLRPLMDALHYDRDDPATYMLGEVMPEITSRLRAITCAKHICVFERNDAPPTHE